MYDSQRAKPGCAGDFMVMHSVQSWFYSFKAPTSEMPPAAAGEDAVAIECGEDGDWLVIARPPNGVLEAGLVPSVAQESLTPPQDKPLRAVVPKHTAPPYKMAQVFNALKKAIKKAEAEGLPRRPQEERLNEIILQQIQYLAHQRSFWGAASVHTMAQRWGEELQLPHAHRLQWTFATYQAYVDSARVYQGMSAAKPAAKHQPNIALNQARLACTNGIKFAREYGLDDIDLQSVRQTLSNVQLRKAPA